MVRRTVTTNEEAKKKRDLFKKSSEVAQFSQEVIDSINDWITGSSDKHSFAVTTAFNASVFDEKADRWRKTPLGQGDRLLITGIYRSEKTGNSILKFYKCGSARRVHEETIELKMSEASTVLLGFDDFVVQVLTQLGLSEGVDDKFVAKVEEKMISEQDKKLNQFASYKKPVNGIECGSW